MVFVIAYVWLLRAFEETNFKTFVLRQHRNSQMRSLDSTHYKYSSSWDLTFRWQHYDFYYALQIHQADGNIARLLYLFVIWQTPTLRSLKKIFNIIQFKSYSRRSNMMTCFVFFPSENYQSRYQSLRPYNKMVMLTQLGYILKFT